MSKKKIFIITGIIFVVIAIIGINYYFYVNNGKISQETSDATDSTIQEIGRSQGGYIKNDGYEISYVPGTDYFIITVFKEPFETYKKEAEDYLESLGNKLCAINYLVAPAKGVDGEEYNSPRSCD
ncbi:MAG: hypothetical protein PHW75_01670 [Patescibacteria group bacterium]|nr:hypothetical protein [Patescibacteria group bacterium]